MKIEAQQNNKRTVGHKKESADRINARTMGKVGDNYKKNEKEDECKGSVCLFTELFYMREYPAVRNPSSGCFLSSEMSFQVTVLL